MPPTSQPTSESGPEDAPEAIRRPRRGRPSTRGLRTEEALEAAANVLNETGLTNTSLAAVAEQMGVTKSALYYYFASKEEVVYKSYLRTCGLATDYAQEAAAGGGSGRERFVQYLKLHFAAPPVAFLSDIAFLTPAHQREVRAQAHRHDDLLSGILEGGDRDGSLVVKRPHVTNFAVTGALNWVFVWFQAGPRYLTRPQVGEAFTDIFLHGMKPDGPPMSDWPAPLTVHTAAGLESAFDRSFQASQRREVLLKTASEFFNHKGFDNSSIDDIAAALDVSRGALYHYVSNKEELLFGCYMRSLALTDQVLDQVETAGGAGLEMQARFIASMIELNAGPLGPIAGYFRLQSLTPAHREEARRMSQGLIDKSRYSERGMADGSVRESNAVLSRRAIMGALNWLPRWYSPTGLNSSQELTDTFCSLFINGLAPR
jgi:AcrR family transcriptional regulator